MSPSALILAAFLSPDHRAEDGDVVVLVERDLSLVVLERLSDGSCVGFHGLSVLGARGVIERLRAEATHPTDLLVDMWTSKVRELNHG